MDWLVAFSKLSPMIGQYIREDIETFCSSGAMSVYGAYHQLAERFVLGDTLEPIVSLLREIVENPLETSNRYRVPHRFVNIFLANI